MELKRDNKGYLDISHCYLDEKTAFIVNGKKYYFKLHKNEPYTYFNEIIAEELAKDFNIPCAHYDLAKYNNNFGVISENFIQDNEVYYNIEKLLNSYGFTPAEDNYNLERIWDALSLKYKDEKIVFKLMDQLVNIFIYDILTANYDRHECNLIIIEGESDVNFSKIFDNENIFDLLAI